MKGDNTMKYNFICTQSAYNALCGLAYRIADNAYMIERYGRENCSVELAENKKTIGGLFADLDALRVPFWVQNTVICWAEDWRRYKTDCIVSAFDKFKNNPGFLVDFSGVSVF